MVKTSLLLVLGLIGLVFLSRVDAASCSAPCALELDGPKAEAGLPVILADPAGDSLREVDVIEIAGGSTSSLLSLEVTFTPSTTVTETGTAILLDLDQNVNTGTPTSEIWFALPTQTVGCENLLSIAPDVVEIRTCAFPTTVLATVIPTLGADSIFLSVPLTLLNNDDGYMNLALIAGDFDGPVDWAPEVGHATVEVGFHFSEFLPIILNEQ